MIDARLARWSILLAAWAAAARPLEAQREYYGLSGSFGVAQTRLAFDSSAQRARMGANIRMGVRICALCWADRPGLTVTPSIDYAITDVRGMTRGVDPYAFSRLDYGAQLAWSVTPRLRPYVTCWLKTRRTAEIERDTTTPNVAFREPSVSGADAWPVNFVDSHGDRTFTWGLELPVTPAGRGFDVSFTRLSGRFTETEFRKSKLPVSLGYRGWTLSAGYTGPLTFATPPWR